MESRRRVTSDLLLIGALALVLGIAGCASSGDTQPSVASMPQTASDTAATAQQDTGIFKKMLHAVGIGKHSDAPPEIGQLPLKIFTATNLNAGNGTHGIALILKVYHLRSPDKFEQMNFNDFLSETDAQAKLGTSLIDDHKMLLLPDKQYFSTEALPQGTKYIGFVALFRGPAAHRWRFVYDVEKSAPKGITLGIHGCAMSSTSGDLVTELNSPAGSLASVHCPKPGL